MSTATTIPLTVSPEAAARVANLGFQREFEAILEHTRQAMPGLLDIAVTLEPYPEDDSDQRIILWASRNEATAIDKAVWDWDRWITRSFSADVSYQVVLMPLYGVDTNGR